VGQILCIKVLAGQKSVQKRIGGTKRTFLGGNVYNYNNYFQEKYLPGHSKSHGAGLVLAAPDLT
jgi:hypothetical protein